MFGLTCHQYKPLTEGFLFLHLWNILKESFPRNVVGKNHYKYATIRTKKKRIKCTEYIQMWDRTPPFHTFH
jgi:hypothetical protein